MIDVTNYPLTIRTINAIINNGGSAEIKLEHGGKEIVVVETSRHIKSREATKQ